MRTDIARWVWALMLLSACATVQGKPGSSSPSLATSLEELLPHSDGDHLVYVWQRRVDGRPAGAGVQVEHLSALGGGEFEVALSENGMPTGRVRIRDTDKAILIVNEDDFARGIRLSYTPPLTYLEVPVVSGERHMVTTAVATQLGTGQAIGSLQVTQTVQASVATPVHNELGSFERPIQIRTRRRLEGAEGAFELSSVMVMVPGLGEIRSDGEATGAPAVHRELACATLKGRHLGDCRNLNARVQELEGAGSTDVQ